MVSILHLYLSNNYKIKDHLSALCTCIFKDNFSALCGKEVLQFHWLLTLWTEQNALKRDVNTFITPWKLTFKHQHHLWNYGWKFQYIFDHRNLAFVTFMYTTSLPLIFYEKGFFTLAYSFWFWRKMSVQNFREWNKA